MSRLSDYKPVTESRLEYRGYKCVVIFQPMGFRCGYVALPEDSNYYECEYNEIPIMCHGGLTYANARLNNESDDEKMWWIGFDCAHWQDGYDFDKLEELGYKDDLWERIMKIEPYPPKTVEYCEAECRRIVDQIIELEAKNEDDSGIV